MTYKGYEGVARFDEEAGVFAGEVINTRDVITFQGTSVKELRKAFEGSIDDYLEFCASRGEEPEKPFSGALTLRMTPELHRQIAAAAYQRGKSINAYIIDRLKAKAEFARIVKVGAETEHLISERASEAYKTALAKRKKGRSRNAELVSVR